MLGLLPGMSLTAQAAETTVTWSGFQPYEIYLHDGESTTKDGVTLKAIKGMAVVDRDDGFMLMGTNGGDSFEFSVAEGKITKIVIACSYGSSIGTGWSGFTWTGSASSVNFGNYANNVTSITFTIENSTPAATLYNLTLADGSNAHGSVAFTVDGAAATQAKKDDVVTVSVTPATGYAAKEVFVKAHTTWESANARAFRAPAMLKDIEVNAGTAAGTWQFTMPEANVVVEATYTKIVQNAWIQNIANQTYTSVAIEPTVTVADGSVTLVLGTDYTITYSNNINVGTATVTVTGIGDYSGTATKTFAIQKADITMTTAPAAVAGLVYSGEPQTLVSAGVASFGTVLYSTDGTTFSSALPKATDAGTHTVYYKVEGDANHNAFAAQQLNVTIATNKTELNLAINDAEEYYNTIKDSNPEAAATLLAAINTAKDVKNNANATQAEIEAATSTLGTAMTTAQADVALKRVSITIPAKSYMSCIDADKRQIETAVSGVALYTVKSVSDTEVTLTSALNVVDAETPFIIYNNNDEDKTFCLVVSSSDADNVTYDSEHFKGTLTAKTFSAADMQAKDHYVLNGHNFVWVKDAGTLAAGKCWIELPKSASSNARALNIVFEDEMATGISTIEAAAENDAYYTIDGRRVAQPTKGIYIVNGKKVVVK